MASEDLSFDEHHSVLVFSRDLICQVEHQSRTVSCNRILRINQSFVTLEITILRRSSWWSQLLFPVTKELVICDGQILFLDRQGVRTFIPTFPY